MDTFCSFLHDVPVQRPLDDRERAEVQAALAQRRVLVWLIGLCFLIAIGIGAVIAPWVAVVIGALGVVVTPMAVARYRKIAVAVNEACH